MPTIHFLNVRNGDCSIIQHGSNRVSMIDVSCAFTPTESKYAKAMEMFESRTSVPGNFNQKAEPDNPIEYLKKHGISSIFRFILTHPDMDHLDGIKELFSEVSVGNFWDTDNTKELDEDSFGSRLKLRDDWLFYKNLRDSKPVENPKRLVYYSGESNDFYNADGLTILAPTKELIEIGNEYEDWNDASYVILYTIASNNGNPKKIVFSGDSEDGTWAHILDKWKDKVSDLDILIAPHHGRDSGRDFGFLDVVKPKLTIFGNASSDHLAYDAWYNRKLPIVTNNQAGYIIINSNGTSLDVFVKHESYASKCAETNSFDTYKHDGFDAWYIGTL